MPAESAAGAAGAGAGWAAGAGAGDAGAGAGLGLGFGPGRSGGRGWRGRRGIGRWLIVERRTGVHRRELEIAVQTVRRRDVASVAATAGRQGRERDVARTILDIDTSLVACPRSWGNDIPSVTYARLLSLLPYLRRYRRAYAAGLALVVVSNGFAVLGPRFFSRASTPSDHAPFREVQVAIGLLLLVAALGGIARYGMRELLNSGSRRVETDLRDQLYLHLQRMAAEFYDRYPTGDVMARTTNDLLAVRMVAGPALMYLVDTTLRALLIAPFMLAISPRLTVLALIPDARPAAGHDVARPA